MSTYIIYNKNKYYKNLSLYMINYKGLLFNNLTFLQYIIDIARDGKVGQLAPSRPTTNSPKTG